MKSRYEVDRQPHGYVVYDLGKKPPLRVKVGMFADRKSADEYAAFLNTDATPADAALGREVAKAAAALGEIVSKCEQYWNESGIGDAEVHSMLGFIHTRATSILARLSPAPAEGASASFEKCPRCDQPTDRGWRGTPPEPLVCSKCEPAPAEGEVVHRTDAYGNPCVYTKEEAARLADVDQQMAEADWRSVGVRIEHDEEGPSVWVEHVCVARVDHRKDKAAGYDACLAEQERTARAIADAFAWYRRNALEALVESLAEDAPAEGEGVGLSEMKALQARITEHYKAVYNALHRAKNECVYLNGGRGMEPHQQASIERIANDVTYALSVVEPPAAAPKSPDAGREEGA